MTNKKFKHIPSGKIYEHIDGGTMMDEHHCKLPIWITDNSTDWEEIVDKQLLLKTQDGVNIFEGDEFYWVNSNFDRVNITKDIVFYKDHKQLDIKWFSTKEAAEEYILMHKPCLSLNEVLKQHHTWNTKLTKSFKEMLQNIVKSKL